MPGFVTNIRGFVQGIVRSAAQIGRTAIETFTSLAEQGFDYAREQFDIDFARYDAMSEAMDLAYSRPSDQLVPGGAHIVTDRKMQEQFQYDVQSTWLDAEGNEREVTRTIFSIERRTLDEVQGEAEAWPEDYEEEGWQRNTGWELVAGWSRERYGRPPLY